jgi:hypothetical protein
MLKELTPFEELEDELLFYWEDILDNIYNGNYKYSLVKKLNNIFDLKWELEGNKDSQYYNDLIHFAMIKDNSLMVVGPGSNNALSVRLDKKQPNEAYLAIMNSGAQIEKTLRTRKNKKNGKLGIYTTKNYPNPVWYLAKELNKKGQKLVSEIKYKCPYISQYELENLPAVLEIKDDRDYWLYSLNFLGFLLYLAGESEMDDISKSNQRIRDVISNPSIKQKIPMLKCCEEFEEVGVDVIDLLRQIGKEFQAQVIDYNNNHDYLLLRVVERYYNAISNYFEELFGPLIFFNKEEHIKKYMDLQNTNKLNEYRLDMLKVQEILLTKRIKKVKQLQQFYSSINNNNDNE